MRLIISILRLVYVPGGLSGVEYCEGHEGPEFPITPSPSPPSLAIGVLSFIMYASCWVTGVATYIETD